MTRTGRKIIFFLLFVAFFLLAPTLILYSQGYRWDFEEQRLTQTGGIFLKVIPKQTRVYVNEKLTKKTDFLFGSVLIENLLPKEYNIQVRKTGFSTWEKNLQVEEKTVTEAKNVLLFPQSPHFNFIQKEIDQLWFSPDGKEAIWKEEAEEEWALKLYDLNNQLKSHLVTEKDFSRQGAEIKSLEFSPFDRNVSLLCEIEGELKSFTLDLGRTPPRITENEETDQETEIPGPIPSFRHIITYGEQNNNYYYLDATGTIYRINASSLQEEKIAELPSPVPEIETGEITFISGFIFLKGGGSFYQTFPEEKKIEKLSQNFQALKVSPDNKKMAYFSGHEIKVLFLEETDSQPKRQKGEDIFLVRLSEQIKDLFWLNSEYLIYNSEGGIQIIEIDNRDGVNIVKIAEFQDSQMVWKPEQESVYVYANQSLWFSQPLLP
ncbi:MAG: hypothetical protein GF370_00310 [Candidatus Nealsonbacteria bacterium]|nr:hypothetical protein [Candidatus Nealsonbacteria bacterium]